MERKANNPEAGYGIGVLVALIIGITLAMAMLNNAAFVTRSTDAKRARTIEKMDRIVDAITNYQLRNAHLPCPAGLALSEGNANFGVADNCNKSTPTFNNASPNFAGSSKYNASDGMHSLWHGAVPIRALNLPREYMYDEWGNRFSYVVLKNLAADSTAAPNDYNSFVATDGAKFIRVNDKNGTILPEISGSSSLAVGWILISHGQNGNGAYNRAGNLFPCDSSFADFDNCNTNNGTGHNFIDDEITDQPGTQPANYFDDIVRWRMVK